MKETTQPADGMKWTLNNTDWFLSDDKGHIVGKVFLSLPYIAVWEAYAWLCGRMTPLGAYTSEDSAKAAVERERNHGERL